MLTILSGERKTILVNYTKTKRDAMVEDFCSFIEEYDPEFIFLPALCIAKRFDEKKYAPADFRKFFNEMCAELEIENGTRKAKIYRLALEMSKRRNH